MGLVACSSEVASISDEEVASVPVEVTFTGFDVSVLPDAPKKVRSRATAYDAGVTRIAFKAFDIIHGGIAIFQQGSYVLQQSAGLAHDVSFINYVSQFVDARRA